MRLIIADRLPVIAGRYAIQETTLEVAHAIVQEYANSGVEIVGMVNKETANHISEALGYDILATTVDLKHKDELIVFDQGKWWHCWYYND